MKWICNIFNKIIDVLSPLQPYKKVIDYVAIYEINGNKLQNPFTVEIRECFGYEYKFEANYECQHLSFCKMGNSQAEAIGNLKQAMIEYRKYLSKFALDFDAKDQRESEALDKLLKPYTPKKLIAEACLKLTVSKYDDGSEDLRISDSNGLHLAGSDSNFQEAWDDFANSVKREYESQVEVYGQREVDPCIDDLMMVTHDSDGIRR